MTLNSTRARFYLKNFELEKLFVEELGWDRHSVIMSVTLDGHTHELQAVAQKRGVQILRCSPNAEGRIPDYAARRKIEKQITKSAYEHLLIFTDDEGATQIWQWVARRPRQPAQYREHPYHTCKQSGDALIQKLSHIYFPLDEEEALDLTGTVHRLRDAFDRDRVTKRFYDRFKSEHATFLGFLKGITDQGDREWYASLMLNRLMFVYFIQRKGFLDGQIDYLRDRMRKLQARKGKGKFLTFYRYFLLALFHEGFAKEQRDRRLDSELVELLGTVPYLNGGLFDVHELEQKYPKVDISDEAFEKLFDFFDQYEWHLDSRPLRNDREINPDVLGYIFEKYINQKQMGAYYTKEDITEYISKNTIIPYLCDAAKKKCAVAFEPGSALWRLLRDDPDRYIYPAVRHGVIDAEGNVVSLPKKIEAGIKNVAKRDGWNRPAPAPFALPTETWREHVARRQRCLELREKLAAGEVHEVNDLVTYNLNIRQFAEDCLTECEGPELLRAFWLAIRDVTVLDPTCGSGAFLFAALGILQPLYEACLDRMQAFVEDLERSGERRSPKKFDDFREDLAEVARHPSRDYFILKSIIVHNLYGVDIMEEAVEICKLRLFLKLVSQVDRVDHLEPLPDVDFNIRPGNTLVGFATLSEIRESKERERSGEASQKLLLDSESDAEIRRIEEDAELVDRAFCKFHEMQTQHCMDGRQFTAAKQELRQRLKSLVDQLDRFLAGDYGVDADKHPKKFKDWRASHQPFHWFAEFFGIMADGGFAVIIGNPPWIEYARVKRNYTIRNYLTESCGNLHGVCTERGLRIRSALGYMSFIVQLPLVSSLRMVTARRVLRESSACLHVIPFGDRPGKLFDGLEHSRATIWISSHQRNVNVQPSRLATSRYQRWPTAARTLLFDMLEYASIEGSVGIPLFPDQFPKYANELSFHIFQNLKEHSDHTINDLVSQRETRSFVFYQEATEYWVKATVGLPYYAKNGNVGSPAHGRFLHFANWEVAFLAGALMHSSLFYVYFTVHSDCFHLNDGLVRSFPVPTSLIGDKKLAQLGNVLMGALRGGAERKAIQTKAGDKIAYDEYFGWKAKPTIDRIDGLLGRHYGFTPEELDFIINYDIKYRMGQNNGEDDE